MAPPSALWSHSLKETVPTTISEDRVKKRTAREPRCKTLAFPVVTWSRRAVDITSVTNPLPDSDSEQEAAREEENLEQMQAAVERTESRKLHFKNL